MAGWQAAGQKILAGIGKTVGKYLECSDSMLVMAFLGACSLGSLALLRRGELIGDWSGENLESGIWNLGQKSNEFARSLIAGPSKDHETGRDSFMLF